MFQLDRTWPLLFPSSSSPSPFFPSCSQVFPKFCSQFFHFSLWKFGSQVFIFCLRNILSGFSFSVLKFCFRVFIFDFESFALSFLFSILKILLYFFHFQLLPPLKLCSQVFVFFFYLETKHFLLSLGLLLSS